ncbi:MAG: DUF4282 domain-containing protein [candidate division KSB1 bacterium]|nr:DUF4282 domain-containing protein [candidate division KSB1 bacterium]MDZ7319320.1 DUF4282 domain-containing protein [candidate division KSB1 bacterium]MDZ7340477.1 DUF4282 domain-containing protein [candidate division KSB1 bacterium]
MQEPSGFFTRLYDFSFSEFITPKIISTLFGIGILAAAFGAFVFIGWGFKAGGFFFGLLCIILSPLVFVFYTIILRVGLEITIILFRIADHVTTIAAQKKEK